MLSVLTDHIACEQEEELWAGLSFEEFFQQVVHDVLLDSFIQLQNNIAPCLS
ncbi:hypothetical protein GCM10023187_09630 [Nibrella viscosa]|uniref:Uncharacterized protein n=1 Tax=Nibrella viscosa TaxID=1084524 RepID=A0ABP8K0F6_9BACT